MDDRNFPKNNLFRSLVPIAPPVVIQTVVVLCIVLTTVLGFYKYCCPPLRRPFGRSNIATVSPSVSPPLTPTSIRSHPPSEYNQPTEGAALNPIAADVSRFTGPVVENLELLAEQLRATPEFESPLNMGVPWVQANVQSPGTNSANYSTANSANYSTDGFSFSSSENLSITNLASPSNLSARREEVRPRCQYRDVVSNHIEGNMKYELRDTISPDNERTYETDIFVKNDFELAVEVHRISQLPPDRNAEKIIRKAKTTLGQIGNIDRSLSPDAALTLRNKYKHDYIEFYNKNIENTRDKNIEAYFLARYSNDSTYLKRLEEVGIDLQEHHAIPVRLGGRIVYLVSKKTHSLAHFLKVTQTESKQNRDFPVALAMWNSHIASPLGDSQATLTSMKNQAKDILTTSSTITFTRESNQGDSFTITVPRNCGTPAKVARHLQQQTKQLKKLSKTQVSEYCLHYNEVQALLVGYQREFKKWTVSIT